ncbi:MAG: dsbA [Parachlamydiales bacterium]|nr:dsbA [Parachlamydiales bacterium]
MDRKPTFIHLLVIATAVVSALLIAIGAVYEASVPLETNELRAEGRPRIGRLEAKVEMVLIEDPRCGACYYFMENIFPEIYEKYIETGRAYCIVVPVSFLEGSEPLANAILAVNKQAPEQFLAFLHAVFVHFHGRESNGWEQKEVLDVAQSVGGIDLKRLRDCILTNCYSKQLEQNFDWGKRIMGRDFGVPTLYINGMRTSIRSADAIGERIEKLEKHK